MTFDLIDDVYQLPPEWAQLTQDHIFLSPGFLSIIQDSPLESIQQHYLTFVENGTLRGVAVLQIKHFELNKSLRSAEEAPGLANRVKNMFAGMVNYRILVVGNLLLTGNYGYYFAEDIPIQQQKQWLDEGVAYALQELKKRKLKVSGTILKDYAEDLRRKHYFPQEKTYTEFSVQPGMHLELRPHWDSLESYMADMKSKYRVRVRKALKTIEPIDKRILSLEEIKSLEQDIFRLYRYVCDGAGFNMFLLPPDYFYKLKQKLGAEVEIVGYFLDGKLLGFYSAINNGGHLDAHFLGYDPAYNKEYKLYFNMLLGLISYGIDRNLHCIQMSRTAMEIKSTVGAVATDYFLYLHADNGVINRFTDRLLQYFIPKDEWQPRQPFK